MELDQNAFCGKFHANLCGDSADSWFSRRPLIFELKKGIVGLWVSGGQNIHEKSDSEFSKNIEFTVGVFL